jgi:hypothetical protein
MKIENEKFVTEIEFENTYDPRRSENQMFMTVGGCTVTRDGKEVGDVYGAIGGGIVVTVKESPDVFWCYFVSPAELWRAVSDVHSKRTDR